MLVLSKNMEDGVEYGKVVKEFKDCDILIDGVVLNEYISKKNILRM